jgi:predicted lipoprotein
MELFQLFNQNIKVMKLSTPVLYSALVVISFSFLFQSCKKDEEELDEFDKQALTTNLSSNIIVPSINEFFNNVTDLQSVFTTFKNDNTQQNLELVRNSWKQAYFTWQTVKIFDFGPIRNIGMKGAIATYPVDTSDIANNIATGSYSLSSAANADAIGLPALDYLLYRVGAIDSLQNNLNCINYFEDLISKMVSEANTINSEWASYKSTFNSSTSTSSTSAFSLFINEFNRDFELAKTAKVGIPLGKQSLDVPLPEYIEARYSGISLELLFESLKALRMVYNGNSFSGGTAGVGLDDYLLHLERSTLDNTIDSNFDEMLNKVQTFNNTFEEEINTNSSGLNELYLMLQGQVVNIKTDMTSALGVLITYQDNDGD